MSARKEPAADLEAIKKRLKEREKAAPPAPRPPSSRRAPAQPAVPPLPPPPPAPPVSFDDEMQRMGVAPAPGGPERLIVKPIARGGVLRAGSEAAAGLPAELDEDALWSQSMKGVVDRKKGVARHLPERSEALPSLDLHGFSEEDAVHELRRFVQLHRGAQARWVRVIVGRGTHGPGVLRRATVGWLQANSSIAGFRPAPPAEGGVGVLLVQLTRKAQQAPP